MRKNYLCTLLIAFLASISLAVSTAHAAPATPAASDTAQVASAAKINLNTADVSTLQRELSGIGESKAKAIVAYREANGDFASVDELLEVKGIGESILQKNRDKLSIN